MSSLLGNTLFEGSASSLFLQYLDNALDVYGSSVKQVVYWKFEKTHHLSKKDVYAHPEKFVETIRTIFGTGMSSIEKDMIRKLELCSGMSHLDSNNLVVALRQLKSTLIAKGN